MSDVFYLRPVDPPIQLGDLPALAAGAQGCFGIHRVHWRLSLLADDGSAMLCWYQAPDAEAVRVALRQLGSDMSRVWAGVPKPPLDPAHEDILRSGTVLVELSAAESADLQAAVDRTLDQAGLDVVCRIDALDGRRCALLVHADDPVRVGNAFHGPDFTATNVWSCNVFTPSA